MSTAKGNLLVLSDPHSGHRFGLTPPSWHRQAEAKKIGTFARQTWTLFCDMLKRASDAVEGFSRVAVLGDIIDGRGERSGGTELLTTSQIEQVSIFTAILGHVKTHCRPNPSLWVCNGTAYHTASGSEDWEDCLERDKDVARWFPKCVHVDGHGQADICGTVFDLKHHVGRNVYWTRGTAMNREHMHNVLWADVGGQDRAHVILRGHVHYFSGIVNRRVLGLTCPCLSWGSKFGIRRCGDPIDWGIIYFDNICDGHYDWKADVRFADCQRMKTVKF